MCSFTTQQFDRRVPHFLLTAPFRPRPLPPLRPPNCVNGKATAAFANFAAAATKATAQLQQELHKCICIYSYI